MLLFQDFLTKFNGQQNVGNTPANKGQCVGLIEEWIDNLGLPHVWGNAKDLLANADPDAFEVIPNTPDNVPQQGDIVVFGSNFNNGDGHCGISTGS